MKKINLSILLLFMIFCSESCKTPDDTVPYRKVNFSISLQTTNLVYVGGYEYFTGGVSGIVVYRFDQNTFLAYDRACPYDWQNGGRIEVVNSVYLCDSLCGSIFNILNGSPLKGPCESPLKVYNTYLEDEFTLRVCN